MFFLCIHRGTKKFNINVKMLSQYTWANLISGTLKDPNGGPNKVPPKVTYNVSPKMADEVEFVCIQYYGKGCALHSLELTYHQ